MPTSIDLAELMDLVHARAGTLVEALGPTWYDDLHLPGAINLPTATARRLAPLQLPDPGRTVVVYCTRSTHEAEVVAEILEDLGYRDVRVFGGGKEEWVEAGLPVERPEAEP